MNDNALASEPETLTAALTYARRGWPVAPAHSVESGKCSCKDPSCGKQAGKHPRTRHGLTDATTDEAKIREWWTTWPDANVLIRTGKVGDRYLVCLDIDPRHGGDENLAKLLAQHDVELPITPQCKTGGGGQHIFMWSKLPVKNSANAIGQGIDVRGVGGYVIAAPSTHLSGHRYEWDDDAHPANVIMAETPGWFVALAGLAGERVKVAPGDVVGADISEMFEGGRNNALTQIAGHIRRPGVGERALLAALRIINEDRCKPPLDDWEVERIARSVGSYQAGSPVTADGSDPMPMLTWSQVAAPLPDIPWLVEGLAIAPGAVTIVGGAGGGGKTWAMQAMLVAVASGRLVWGQFAARNGRCIHVDFEQGPYLTRMRYQKIAVGLGIRLEDLDPSTFGLCSLPRVALKVDKASEDLLALKCEGAVMAIVDAFRGAFPDAKENGSEARQYLDMLQRVSERTGCAIIVIMHSRKASDDDDIRSSLRGSSALFDAAQTVYMLDGVPGKPTRVTCTKDRWTGIERPVFGIRRQDVLDVDGIRDGIEIEYMIPSAIADAYATPEKDENDISANVERMVSSRNRLIAVLSAAECLSFGSIVSMLGGSARDWKIALSEMVREGVLRSEGRGYDTMYWYVHRQRQPGED